jgi:dihydrofolate synthase/folylpolyglutamate synthase
MLADKDIISSIATIREWIDEWYTAPLKGKRAAPMTMLEDSFTAAGVNQVSFFDSIEAAYDQAIQEAKPGDRLLIFGSFHTVSEVWLHKGAN